MKTTSAAAPDALERATVDHELRVLTGLQRGASVPLHMGVAYHLSGEMSSDIVLRDCGRDNSAAQITLQPQGVQVKSLAGHVQAGGQTLAIEQQVLVPWLSGIQVGQARLAVGALGDAAWAPLFADAGTTLPSPDADQHSATNQSAAGPRPWGWGRRLVVGGGAVAAASLSMLALAVVIAPKAPGPAEIAHKAQTLLQSAGFTAVSVVGSDSELVVNGYLDSHAQRTRAEQVLASHGLQARMAVWVNESVTLSVRDVYRVHGVQADVESFGPGAVKVRTSVANAAPLAAIEAAVRRDVRGLNQLQTKNEAPPHSPSPIPTMDDPGKRVASVVAGADPYVVTLDGTRYFIGALLPTGHRIMGISGSEVKLEREGELTALVF
jgi:type III secretion protein D